MGFLRRSVLLTQAFVVAALFAMSVAPSARAGEIFWTQNDSTGHLAIGDANLDGTGVNTALITPTEACGTACPGPPTPFDTGEPARVAVDETSIYFTNLPASNGRANLDGTGVNPDFAPIGGNLLPTAVAIDGNYVYWGNWNTRVTSISRTSLDGTTVVDYLVTGIGQPSDMAVSRGYIYWTSWLDGPPAQHYGIGRANLDGTGVNNSFLPGANTPFAIAVNGSYIYWANQGENAIGRANLDGTGVNNSFITGASTPDGVGVHGNYIYWTNYATGTIGRANLDGTDPNQNFITGLDQPVGLAVLPEPTAGLLVLGGVLGLAITRRLSA